MFHLSVFLPIINIIVYGVEGKYQIKRNAGDSYLYHKFEDVGEDIFPADIRINMSLSRISGTLLYSLDRNNNQFILNLHDNMGPTLNLEFRNQEHVIQLYELCGCRRCLYKPLDIRVNINDTISIQCNEIRTPLTIQYDKTKNINKNYPIQPFERALSGNTRNQAHLWLVNTQRYGDTYPNNYQLYGCIFNVSYKGQEIQFTNISNNVANNCPERCNGSRTCNGGRCYETYAKDPVCDCKTFNNGMYCNESLQLLNVAATLPSLHIQMFKFSWNSTANEILILKNKNVQLRLYREGVWLLLEYDDITGAGSTTISELSRNYVSGGQYVLIATFRDITIFIEIFHNKSWSNRTIWTGRDIRLEALTDLALRSGSGTIGMYYKISDKEILWRKIPINNPVALDREPQSNTNEGIKPCGEGNFAKGYAAVIIPCLMIIATALLFIFKSFISINGTPWLNRYRPKVFIVETSPGKWKHWLVTSFIASKKWLWKSECHINEDQIITIDRGEVEIKIAKDTSKPRGKTWKMMKEISDKLNINNNIKDITETVDSLIRQVIKHKSGCLTSVVEPKDDETTV